MRVGPDEILGRISLDGSRLPIKDFHEAASLFGQGWFRWGVFLADIKDFRLIISTVPAQVVLKVIPVSNIARYGLSIINIPLPMDKSSRVMLIELLDEAEAFLCQLVVSGEDSLGVRLFASNLYDAMINAWRGDPAVPGSSAEERFRAARLKVASTSDAVLIAAGLSGIQLQAELFALMKRADDYNEFGGRQHLAKVVRHLDGLLKSAGLENVMGKVRDYLWASLFDNGCPNRRMYH